MKKALRKEQVKVKIDFLDTKIRTRYPSLYNSLGGEYVRNLLLELYGVSRRSLNHS